MLEISEAFTCCNAWPQQQRALTQTRATARAELQSVFKHAATHPLAKLAAW
jgi:hypothetical protein